MPITEMLGEYGGSCQVYFHYPAIPLLGCILKKRKKKRLIHKDIPQCS